MPVMDGIELIRKIREENRDIYIIVLSCHDDFEYVKEAMRLGADEYVLKNSLDEDSLYDTLEKSAADREAQRKKSGTGTDEKADPSGKSRSEVLFF